MTDHGHLKYLAFKSSDHKGVRIDMGLAPGDDFGHQLAGAGGHGQSLHPMAGGDHQIMMMRGAIDDRQIIVNHGAHADPLFHHRFADGRA